jgi:hypothetical protein
MGAFRRRSVDSVINGMAAYSDGTPSECLIRVSQPRLWDPSPISLDVLPPANQ